MIEPQDVAFLLHELVEPLGRAEDYQDIKKTIVAQSENEEIQNNSVLEKDQQHIIKIERNMILPLGVMIKTLSDLSLPIYIATNGHMCHFKDVCIQLSKKALIKNGLMEDDNF